jgi:AcrR family transcriptional regulator
VASNADRKARRETRFAPPDSTEARVLRAAAEAFAEKSFHGASLRDIADALGIQAASLYHYAPSKQALLATIMLSLLDRRRKAVMTAMADEYGAEARLRAFVRAHVRVQGEDAAQARVCVTELRSLNAATGRRVRKEIARYADVLSALLTEGVDEGVFTVPDPAATVRGLLDAWDGVAWWFRPDGPQSLEQIGEQYAQFAIAAIAVTAPESNADEEIAEVERGSSRDDILRAATELFAERSYSGTTMRELASHADVPPSVIYHYFGSKEGLLYAVLSVTMRKILDEVYRAVASSPRPPEQLAAWIQGQVRAEGAGRYDSLVTEAELHALSDRHRAVILAQRHEYERLLTEVIEQGVREGLFATPRPKLTAYAIARMCSGPGWGNLEDAERLEELGRRYAELTLAGLGYRDASAMTHPEGVER